MNRDLIFGPVLVQVALTLFVYVVLIRTKIRAMRAGKVDLARRALHNDAWPDDVMQINNNIRNQFELPVLFYVLSLMLWALHAVHWLALITAAVFVASRVVHVYIHIGTNYVPARRRAFTVGWYALAAMALLVMLELGRRLFGYGPA
jgi:hypothetical protein